MIGDFNTKSCNWSINDTTTPKGAQLDSITALYGMKQLNSEPTHILQDLLAVSTLFSLVSLLLS